MFMAIMSQRKRLESFAQNFSIKPKLAPMSPVRYLRQHPFSVIALCCIIGDLCYLGFAFSAQGWVSFPKLGGALFTIGAHIILLAYGDDQARHVAQETGSIGRLILLMRRECRLLLRRIPESLMRYIQAKPVGIGFTMLSLNGVGLLVDSLINPASLANFSQLVLGGCVMSGCGAFALADFIQDQKRANFLLKTAPSLLAMALVANAGLILTTHNGFMIVAMLVFLISTFAGFYTKIDKATVS